MSVDRIARLHIQLDDIEPSIWRRVDVPLTMSLKGLHDVIQAVMLFEDYHLFEFEAGGRCYDVSDPEDPYERKTFAARNIRITALIERGIATFKYTYDFGDNWQHTITVEAVEEGNPALEYPRFIDGERRAPPEDVGSTSGFEEFLKVMSKPRHPQHREFVRWYGGRFDPVDISVDIIQDRVAKLARRRMLGKAGFAKSQNKQH
ncbi:plasmid pRiA4b ORF-3 family protein [Rhizobium sp. BR 314]|uniref:plasmid pRiA4b ORF-3 family protein n=1 Tax=Rhizobium sp. BR 314 TaxID=3040013 RepID=UPI0039BED141